MSSTAPAPRNRNLLLLVFAAAAVIVVIVVAIVATSSSGRGDYLVTDGSVTIKSSTVGTLGTVLVTDQGFTLYMFPPDEQSAVTCEDRCALNWPPILIPDGVKLVAGDGVDASMLSTTIAPDGNRVASYDGWPLYTFLGDTAPGVATGQAQYLDGGYWYVLRPNGEVVKPGP